MFMILGIIALTINDNSKIKIYMIRKDLYSI
jgi:hypothetical protein